MKELNLKDIKENLADKFAKTSPCSDVSRESFIKGFEACEDLLLKKIKSLEQKNQNINDLLMKLLITPM